MATLYRTATIANGASLSGAIDIDGSAIVGVITPAAWTAANLTFQASHDDITYNNVHDEFGTEKTVIAAVSRYIPLNPADFIGADSIKIRSGTSGAAVNQGAARSIILVLLTT